VVTVVPPAIYERNGDTDPIVVGCGEGAMIARQEGGEVRLRRELGNDPSKVASVMSLVSGGCGNCRRPPVSTPETVSRSTVPLGAG
jgi:hypothetical protein